MYLCIHNCIIIFDYFIYLNLVFSPVDNFAISILEAILGHLFSVSMYNLFFLCVNMLCVIPGAGFRLMATSQALHYHDNCFWDAFQA